MPFCSQCGNQVSDNARFCRSCGTQRPQRQPQSRPPPARDGSFFQRPVVKWSGMGCGGLLLLFILFGVLSSIFGSVDKDATAATVSKSSDLLRDSSRAPGSVMPTNSVTPSPIPTAEPASDLDFCTHTASNEFILAQNEVVGTNLPRIDRLDTALRQLKSNPGIARNELWANTTLADVRRVKQAGYGLEEAGPVPAPAAEVNEGYLKVAKKMLYFGNLIHMTVTNARMVPSPKWDELADQAEDALNDMYDEIEDVQDRILDECG